MHDRRLRRWGRIRQVLRQPRTDALDGGDLARLVDLPQPAEAAQLALEVAGRLAEALQSGRLPIDARGSPRARRSAARRSACAAPASPAWRARSRRSPRPGSAPSRRRGSRSPPRRRRPQAPPARARGWGRAPAAGAPRAGRRARSGAAARGEGGAGQPRRRRARSGRSRSSGPRRSGSPAISPPVADAVGVEEPPERLQHEQRWAGVALRLGEGLDDVVWRDRAGHDRATLSNAWDGRLGSRLHACARCGGAVCLR